MARRSTGTTARTTLLTLAIAIVVIPTALAKGSAPAAGSTTMWSVYLQVASINSDVTLSPTGQLVDPNCPNNVCRFRYPEGTVVTLTALPGSGSWFEGWQQLYTNPISCTGLQRACTLTMDTTKHVRAAFSPIQLWPSSNKGGHIDVEGGSYCGRGCSSFRYGARATVWAVAHDGYHFDRWTSTRCGSINGDGCTFTMRDNTIVSAYFARNDGLGESEQPVTIYVPFVAGTKGTGSGTISGPRGLSCPSRCMVEYERGRQIALTATPTGGSRFGGWTGVCANTTSTTCVFRSVATASGGKRWATAWYYRP